MTAQTAIRDRIMGATDPQAFSQARDSTREAVRLFRAGCHEPALGILREVATRQPFFTPAIAWQVPVLDALGRAGEVAQLHDFSNSIVIFDLSAEPTPSGNMPDAVAALVRAQIKFKSGSARMPLVRAKITSELSTSRDPVLAQFQQLVMKCFSQYLVRARFRNQDIARVEDCWSSIWATRTCREGRIGAHYHPRSWLTSVFYPTSQRHPAQPCNDCGGNLEFGHVPSYMGTLKTPNIFRVPPQEGRLIIFPAYIGHAVTPVTCATARISVAADLCVIEKEFGAQFGLE
jgi:hypothetical protein